MSTGKPSSPPRLALSVRARSRGSSPGSSWRISFRRSVYLAPSGRRRRLARLEKAVVSLVQVLRIARWASLFWHYLAGIREMLSTRDAVPDDASLSKIACRRLCRRCCRHDLAWCIDRASAYPTDGSRERRRGCARLSDLSGCTCELTRTSNSPREFLQGSTNGRANGRHQPSNRDAAMQGRWDYFVMRRSRRRFAPG